MPIEAIVIRQERRYMMAVARDYYIAAEAAILPHVKAHLHALAADLLVQVVEGDR